MFAGGILRGGKRVHLFLEKGLASYEPTVIVYVVVEGF